MKALLVKDEHTNLDVQECAKALNRICEATKFIPFEELLNLGSQSTFIDFSSERTQLQQRLIGMEKDHVLYSTSRQYGNNYFFYSTSDSTILSFFGWQHYTNLPIENGLFYFVATILALRIDDEFRHEDTTGCIYDFLWDKTGVDFGMKTGHICGDCLKRISKKLTASNALSDVFSDLTVILEILANTSRWGRSVFDFSKHLDTEFSWSSFEDHVAELYRGFGAEVKQNVVLSGFQIDILAEERTPSRQKLRSAVECKFYKKKVGNKTVNDFARVVTTLKDAGSVDRGIMVSYSGFSKDAHLVSQDTHIELVHFKDLRKASDTRKGSYSAYQMIEGYRKSPVTYIQEEEIHTKETVRKSLDVFVIMPFSPELDDLYYLGIHEAAREAGFSCERVDEMEFDGIVLNKVYDSIKNSRIVIAEVSDPNPNVYYELGYAHGLGKPTILITRSISSAPFDTRGFNHIIYSNIRDLRDKLKDRLSAILLM